MMKNYWIFRFLPAVFAFISFQFSLYTATAIPLMKNQVISRHRREVNLRGRQPGLNNPNRTGAVPEFGQWGPWTENSTCSRTCGGGITYQDRICLDVRADGRHSCVGASRRYFYCNTDDCPTNSIDFRAEQCQRFNSVKYKGKYYSWIPYHNALALCALNCKPKTRQFSVKLDSKVKDGTRCRDDGSWDVCVDGQCMEVGCDKVLGSSTKVDECGVCGGDGSSCRVIKGYLDQNDFEIGYNDILLIPSGATSILIQDVQSRMNYLALRDITGKFYLNGAWKIDFPKEIQMAGTVFQYERRPGIPPEVLRAPGPTTEHIFIVLLYQERNLGINYEFRIPAEIKAPEPDSYEWVISETEECSHSCGEGVQIRTVSCTRKSDGDIVDEELCYPVLKPAVNVSCNTKYCPSESHCLAYPLSLLDFEIAKP